MAKTQYQGKKSVDWLARGETFCAGIFRVIETVFVLGISVFVAWLIGLLVFGSAAPALTRSGQIIQLLSENWKALLLLVVPLLYHPVKGFIARSEWSRGVKEEARQMKMNPKKEDY